jgi:hypothetical protein
MEVRLKDVRMAFAQNLFTPAKDDKGVLRYKAAFIIEPGSEAGKAMQAAVAQVAKDKWGAKAPAILTQLKKDNRISFKEEARTNDAGEAYDGFEGMWSASASNKKRPTTINRDRTPVSEGDNVLYSGCYVNAIVDVWPQDNEHGKRINVALTGVQFVRDGDAFGGSKVAAPDAFDDISSEEIL